MTRSDRGRRAVTVVVVALLLLSVPQLALAAFSGRTAPTLAVGSATMVAPANLVGSFTCSKTGPIESIRVSIDGFTDAGPAGSTYRYVLSSDGVLESSSSSRSRSITLTGDQLNDRSQTDWLLTIQATLGKWTSPVKSQVLTCNKGGKGGGSL